MHSKIEKLQILHLKDQKNETDTRQKCIFE